MAEVSFTDAGGASIKLLNVNGRHLPPTEKADQWESILNMKTRSDDVFLCAYPKSGTHWMWEIVTMLIRRDSTPLIDHMGTCILDFHHASKLESNPPPRVYTSHRYYDELPIKAREDRCKIIYMLRDPKDICVSYYNHLSNVIPLGYDGTFGGFIQLFKDGKVPFNSWWEYLLRWCVVKEQHPDQSLLVIHYGEMKKDPVAGIRRMAEYLEVEADDTLIREIVHNTSFDVMKKQKDALELMDTFKGRFKGGASIMYRKGEVGDWKNWLTEQRGEEFRNFFKEKLCLVENNCEILESVKRYLT